MGGGGIFYIYNINNPGTEEQTVRRITDKKTQRSSQGKRERERRKIRKELKKTEKKGKGVRYRRFLTERRATDYR